MREKRRHLEENGIAARNNPVVRLPEKQGLPLKTNPLTYLFVFLLVSGCTAAPRGLRTLQVSIVPSAAGNRSESASLRSAPTSASEFDCLAVNVMGSDIAARKPKANQPSFETILAGGFCSYPGILSELVAPNTSSTITMKAVVPVGTQRVVQVLGIVNPNGCANTAAGSDLEDVLSTGVSSKGTTAVYELGRAIANTTSNVTVNITNAYDPANPKDVTCGATNSPAVAGPDCTIASIENGTPYAAGSGTAADPYYICTVAQLANVSLNLGAQFALAKSIDLTGLSPLASTATPFSGVFDGKGYTLSNFSYLGGGSTFGTGIFGSNSGTIKNLILSGGNLSINSATNDVGFLVGVNSGLVQNITLASTPSLFFSFPSYNVGLVVGNNTGTVDNIIAGSGAITNASNIGNVGGVVGLNAGTVSNSVSSVTVTGNGTVGGVVGRNEGTVTACSSSGSVTGSSSTCAGGAVGISVFNGTVSASSSSGAVTGYASTGGFIGCAYATSVISKCSSTGSVTGILSNTGGFVGEVNGSGTRVELSYSTGSVVGAINNTGGFAGLVTNSGLVRNSYANFTAVTGTDSVGGIVGRVDGSGNVQYAYAIAPTSSLSYTPSTNHGASVGNNTGGSVSNLFASGAMASPSNFGSGVAGGPLISANQTQAATYVGFDFTVPGVWTTNGDTTTPRFQ